MLIIFALALFCAMLFGLAFKRYTLLVLSYIVYVFLYDRLFITINLEYPSLLGSFLQMSQEIIFALVLLLMLLNSLKSRKMLVRKQDLKIGLCVFVPMVVSVLISLMNGDGLGNIIKGVRLYFFPVIVPYVFYRSRIFDGLNLKYLSRLLTVFAIACTIYGAMQVYTFNGSLSELWFYRSAQISPFENAIEDASYNFLRNDSLRATSFFVSSIMMTSLLAFIAVVSLFSQRGLLRLVTVLTCLIGIFLTQTRVGFILFITAIVIYLIDKILCRINKRHIVVLLCIPVIIVCFTFLSIVLGLVTDESAMGRMAQYVLFINYLKPLGLGIGNEMGLIRFDSFLISVLVTMGFISILYLNYFIYLFRQLYDDKTWLGYAMLLVGLGFVYLFAFQFIAGSVTFRLFFIFVFIILAADNERRIFNCIV